MTPCRFLGFTVVKITFHAYIINLTSLPFFQLKLGWGVIYDDLERCERIDATVSTSVHYCQQGEPMFC
jgi:hypothetical protein